MSAKSLLSLIVLVVLSLPLSGAAAESESVSVLSKTFTVDKIYKSMKGPMQQRRIYLLDKKRAEPELLWITGYKVEVVGQDGKTPLSQEFVCHNNLNIDDKTHEEIFGIDDYSSRLVTISQGHPVNRFPEGFGVPIASNEYLILSPQVLNLNHPDETLQVRHKMTVEFVRDRDLEKPMKPLFMRPAQGLVLIEGDNPYFGIEEPNEEEHGPGCLIGENVAEPERADEFGGRFAGHWIVPPGRQVNHSLVTDWIKVPYDTTVHYIACHLHPFATSLELRDLTADKVVFRAEVEDAKGKLGIENVDHFSSVEGVKLYKDHVYELVSVYENPTEENGDAMASMFLYLLDKEFEAPPWLITRENPEGKANADAAPTVASAR